LLLSTVENWLLSRSCFRHVWIVNFAIFLWPGALADEVGFELSFVVGWFVAICWLVALDIGGFDEAWFVTSFKVAEVRLVVFHEGWFILFNEGWLFPLGDDRFLTLGDDWFLTLGDDWLFPLGDDWFD